MGVGSNPTSGTFFAPQHKDLPCVLLASVARHLANLTTHPALHCTSVGHTGLLSDHHSTDGLVVEYLVANEVARVRFPVGAFSADQVAERSKAPV